MWLADPAELRTSLDFDDLEEINLALQEAMARATPVLASMLRTDFDRTTRTDVFFVMRPTLMGTVYSTDLRLRRGHVLPSGYTVHASSTRVGLAASGTRTDLRSHGGVDLTSLQDELGVLNVTGHDLTNMFVAVAYTSGFEADGDEPRLYDQAQVPDWLQQAAKAKATAIASQNPMLRGEEGPLIRKDGLNEAVMALVDDHVRYLPRAVGPQT